MIIKSTTYKWSLVLLLNLCSMLIVNASPLAYCSPTFSSGCSLWNNQSISLGTINWTLGSTSCSVSDYTGQSTILNTGNTYPMTVTNGNWCGCAVWIDFNNDQNFDSTENLYHYYANVTAGYTYNFNITIPSNLNNGIYRMRVIAGWGTDCYSPGANGNGPCGSYQYGNFDDFMVNIVNSSTGIEQNQGVSKSSIQAFPNPSHSLVTVLIDHYSLNESYLELMDITGKIIRNIPVKNEKELIDMSDLSKGIYVLKYVDGKNSQSLRLVN